MRRRQFITVLTGAIAESLSIWGKAARSANKVWRIGYLSTRAGPNELSDSFLQGLHDLGYVESRNLMVEFRGAAGKNELLPELALHLTHANVDLIVTEGTPATQAAIRATKLIPIVFGSAQDPVEKGIVASLAHPGGNATGVALIVDQSKPLELLKEAVPTISHVAFLHDPATRPGAYGEAVLAALQRDAGRLGITVQPVILRDPDETDLAFTEITNGINGLLVENSVINRMAQDRICQFAVQRRLPAVVSFSFTGCLLSYGENLPDVYRRAATYVDKIFKGAHPSDLPVMQATTFNLIINLKTAKELGRDIPASLLARAAEVIE
jgi:putative ABC transport system substrate-binding protein